MYNTKGPTSPSLLVFSLCSMMLFCWGLSFPVVASDQENELINEELPGGLVVSAEYHRGASNRPAIVLIHGFLQTRHYLTVSNLLNGLRDEGFSVLAPTLSLGISARKRSLACEAIHSHDMGKDIAEIGFWVNWLKALGHRHVVLLGHSFGSLHGLVYVSSNKYDPVVKKLITTSLIDLEHSMGSDNLLERNIELARAKQRKGDSSLTDFSMSYCKKYTSPPDAFLSYASWGKQAIIATLKKSPVAVDVIMGEEDKRISANWPVMLASSGANVRVISGANHFFDGQHEFELLEAVISGLK